jgi:hypothetical protein
LTRKLNVLRREFIDFKPRILPIKRIGAKPPIFQPFAHSCDSSSGRRLNLGVLSL